MASIGERIKEYRKNKKLTQRDLGNLIHESPQVISNYERGYTTPDSLSLKKISDVLGVSIDDLMTEKNSELKKKKTADLKDDDLLLTFGGKPISDEDRALIKRLMRDYDEENGNER